MFQEKAVIGPIPGNPLPPVFYRRDTVTVAKELLGKRLAKRVGGEWAGGMIVETEAYLDKDDPSCHAARGKTPANGAMFGPPGIAYVYFTYGMYHCFNAVAFDPKVQRAGAVLIRALQPLWGLELMGSRRNRTKDVELCSGPGKLCMALGLERNDNEKLLWDGDLLITDGVLSGEIPVTTTTRIGISTGTELPLRFYFEDNLFVSRKPVRGR